jgi:hypothetical protein
MKTESPDKTLDQLIRAAIGTEGGSFDFPRWRRAHQDEIARFESQTKNGQATSSNPVPTSGDSSLTETRRTTARTVRIAAAAAVFLFVCLGLPRLGQKDDRTTAWAQMLEQLEGAETVAWKVTFYNKVTSKDGKRTWIRTETRDQAYMAPGLYRDVHFDENGRVHHWTVTDAANMKELSVNPSRQTARIRELATTTWDQRGPFVWVMEEMKDRNLEWIGRRTTDHGEANVFRAAFRSKADNRDWSYDFWVDAKTKRLVAMYVPGADIFDPENDPARHNPPEHEWSLTESTAYARHHIEFDAEVDGSLFTLEPSEGYAVTIESRAWVTEEEMVDWLGLLAEYYEGTFPDEALPPFDVSTERLNAIRDKANRTPVERRLLDTVDHYVMAGLNGMPVVHFFEDHAEKDSFRYLGKGVRLGDGDRIVCWYRFKGSPVYRAVYGDLSVGDVLPEDLPLPVEP